MNTTSPKLSVAQLRAARGLIDWSQERLAGEAGISTSTVRDFERGRRTPREENLDAMRRTLEDAGVEFLASGQTIDGGPGVRLRVDPRPAGSEA